MGTAVAATGAASVSSRSSRGSGSERVLRPCQQGRRGIAFSPGRAAPRARGEQCSSAHLLHRLCLPSLCLLPSKRARFYGDISSLAQEESGKVHPCWKMVFAAAGLASRSPGRAQVLGPQLHLPSGWQSSSRALALGSARGSPPNATSAPRAGTPVVLILVSTCRGLRYPAKAKPEEQSHWQGPPWKELEDLELDLMPRWVPNEVTYGVPARTRQGLPPAACDRQGARKVMSLADNAQLVLVSGNARVCPREQEPCWVLCGCRASPGEPWGPLQLSCGQGDEGRTGPRQHPQPPNPSLPQHPAVVDGTGQHEGAGMGCGTPVHGSLTQQPIMAPSLGSIRVPLTHDRQ